MSGDANSGYCSKAGVHRVVWGYNIKQVLYPPSCVLIGYCTYVLHQYRGTILNRYFIHLLVYLLVLCVLHQCRVTLLKTYFFHLHAYLLSTVCTTSMQGNTIKQVLYPPACVLIGYCMYYINAGVHY